MTVRRLLITGFPPFAGRPVNPTQQLLQAIDSGQLRLPSEALVRTALLPVEYAAIGPAFDQHVAEFQPDIVLAFGVGHRDDLLHLEQVAINWSRAAIPDNAGVIRHGEPVVTNAPAYLLSTLPFSEIVQTLRSAGFSARLSTDAGRFLCNQLLFHGLWRAGAPARYRMGFVHVRPLDATGGSGEVPWPDFQHAIERLLELVIRTTSPRPLAAQSRAERIHEKKNRRT
jgi:pyroglutamyl-peptidase